MTSKEFTSLILRCVRGAFPNADLTQGSLVWTKLINPILEAAGPSPLELKLRDFARAVVRTQHPDVDIEAEGEIDDIVLKPAESLFAPFARELTTVKQQQTLRDLRVHTLESISDLASNFGIVRAEGGYAQGTTRLSFNAPVSERVTPETYFETGNGLRFFASGNQSITSTQMALNHSGDLYYWDVRIIAERPGTIYNAEPNAISRAPTMPRVVRCANLARLGGGLERDSVEDIAAELENYPCTRSIGTRRGTAATALSNLSGVRVVETVGMGDPLMMRDIIRGGELRSSALTYAGGAEVAGTAGRTTNVDGIDPSADMYTTWFADTGTAGVDFISALGATGASSVVEGYYLVCYISGHWYFEKIAEVRSATAITIENRVLPVNCSSITWVVCPAQLTLSEIPGGILWADTPDGECVIRDGEVHVGGQTDVFLMGTTTEDATTDIEALTDEDMLGYGLQVQTTLDSRTVIVDDMEEVAVAGPLVATLIGVGTYDIASIVWGTNQTSHIRAGQVFMDPTSMKRFRILRVGVGVALRLRLILDGDTGGNVNPAYIIRRRPGVDLRNACFRVANGAAAGYYRVVRDMEGDFSDVAHTPGEYTGCRYKVVLAQPAAATTADQPWYFSDDMDIDLSDPKLLRTDGTALQMVAGSDVVFDGSKNFDNYGVAAGDVLRVDSGASADDYVIRDDPFGAGHSFLRLTTVLPGSGTARYRIFKSLAPVQLPLLTMNSAALLDADGSPLTLGSGTDPLSIPYGEPLGAYSESFTNLNRGEKYVLHPCVLGIADTVGVSVTGGAAKIFDPVLTPLCLWVWHRQLGYAPWSTWISGAGYITDGQGGYIVPQTYEFDGGGPYDLDTNGGWSAMISALNALSPYPHWDYVDEDTTPPKRHLVCRPFGALMMLLGWTAAGSSYLNFGSHLEQNPNYADDWALDVLDTGAYVRTVSSADIWRSAGALDILGVGVDQDIFEIITGANTGYADTASRFSSSTSRVRLMTPHAFMPELTASVRVGLASAGLARTYFKDATDFEVDAQTTYAPEDDVDTVFIPDPTGKKLGQQIVVLRAAHSTLIPAYPETEKPDNGWGEAGAAPWYAVFHGKTPTDETDFWAAGVRPGDYLEVTYRDIITTRTVWPPYGPLGADEVLTLTVGDRVVTVTFSAGSTYTMQQTINAINTAFGDTIAMSGIEAPPKIHLRWQELLAIGGSALGGGKILGAGTPPLYNYAFFYGTYRIADIRLDGTVPSILRVERNPATPANDTDGCRVQYRILRPGMQRFSALEMAENVGVGGLYYADVELVGRGVGDRFNIAEDRKMVISGARARGYRLSNANPELSFSTTEELWLHIDNYFQPTSAPADAPENDQAVFGSGMRLYYERSPLVSSAQALFNSREERDNNQSVLARHLFPYYVNCDLSYAGGSLESVVLPAVENLITGRDPSEPLDVSDILGVITSYNADHVDMPVELAVIRHQKDRSLDVLVGKDRVETPRLSGFLPGNITLTRRA